MADIALGLIGAGIGSLYGNPMLGFSLGMTLGGMLFPPDIGTTEIGRLQEGRINGSTYGTTIPIYYGSIGGKAGIIVWASEWREEQSADGYSYKGDFAVMVCRGPIEKIGRIYANGEVIYDDTIEPRYVHKSLDPDKIRIYLGTDDQPADPAIVEDKGDYAPAYRRRAYVVFEDYPVRQGGQLDNFTFDVQQRHDLSSVDFLDFSDASGVTAVRLADDTEFRFEYELDGSELRLTATSEFTDAVHAHTVGIVTFANPIDLSTVDTLSFSLGWVNKGYAEKPVPADVQHTWKLWLSEDGATVLEQYPPGDHSSATNRAFVAAMSQAASIEVTGEEASATDPLTAVVDISNIPAGDRDAVRRIAFQIPVIWRQNSLRIPMSSITLGAFDSDAAQSVELAEVVEDLGDMVGLEAGDLDLGALAGIRVRGLAIMNRTELRNVLRSLEQAYTFDFFEADDLVQARRRGTGTPLVLDQDWLGARAGTEGAASRLTITRGQEADIPRRVDVAYISAAQDYQTMTVHATRQYGGSQEAETISLPVVLTEDEARSLAVIAVHIGWLQRDGFRLTTSWRDLRICAADLLYVPTPVGLLLCRVVEVRMSLLGEIEVFAVEEEPAIYSLVATGPTAPGTPPVGDARATDGEVFDINALTDEDADDLGFYAAMWGASPWRGGAVESLAPRVRTLPSGAPTRYVSAHPLRATAGRAETVLGDNAGAFETWDDSSFVDVLIESGEVASASDEDVLNGANMAVLGSEVIQFADVAAQGGGVYRLSRLLRGRRGSDWAMDGHEAGERFLLADTSLRRVDVPQSEVGVSHQYQYVEGGATYAVMFPSTDTLTVEGNSRKPYSPVHLEGDRDGSSNLVISWVRRARKDAEWEDYGDVPLDEASEAYEIDVYSADWSTVERTISSTTTSAVYTAAEQTTDFGSPQATLNIEVFQIGGLVGRGFGRRATI